MGAASLTAIVSTVTFFRSMNRLRTSQSRLSFQVLKDKNGLENGRRVLYGVCFFPGEIVGAWLHKIEWGVRPSKRVELALHLTMVGFCCVKTLISALLNPLEDRCVRVLFQNGRKTAPIQPESANHQRARTNSRLVDEPHSGYAKPHRLACLTRKKSHPLLPFFGQKDGQSAERR